MATGITVSHSWLNDSDRVCKTVSAASPSDEAFPWEVLKQVQSPLNSIFRIICLMFFFIMNNYLTWMTENRHRLTDLKQNQAQQKQNTFQTALSCFFPVLVSWINYSFDLVMVHHERLGDHWSECDPELRWTHQLCALSSEDHAHGNLFIRQQFLRYFRLN